MRYKIDDSGEKKIIRTMLLLIVIVIIVCMSIYLYNNTKYIYVYNFIKVKNKISKTIKKEATFLGDIINENMCVNLDAIVNNLEGNEEKTNVVINKSKGNKYNSIKINNGIYIYEENGIFYANIPNDNKLIKLNQRAFDMEKFDENIILNFLKVFNTSSSLFINQLNDSDFYKLPYTITNDKGREITEYIHGITLSEKRMQEILVNVLGKIREDKKTIEKISQSTNIEKKEIMETIDYWAVKIKEYNGNDNLKINVEMKTFGLLNLTPAEISLTIEDNNVIINKVNIISKDNGFDIVFPKYNSEKDIKISAISTNSKKELVFEKKDVYGTHVRNSVALESYTNEKKILNSYMLNDKIFNTELKITKHNTDNQVSLNGTYIYENREDINKKQVVSIIGNITNEKVDENIGELEVVEFNEIAEEEKEYIRAYLVDTWNFFDQII